MDGLTGPALNAVPALAPLAMPVQSLGVRARGVGRPASSPPRMWLRRLVVVGGAVALTVAATREMVFVLGVNGLTSRLAYFILALFVSLFAWIALALTSGICGFVSVLAGGGRRLALEGPPLPLTGARPC